MATDPGTRAGHPTIDPNSLYREEIFTDRAVGMSYLCVEDTGPGIAVEEREKVFERFYRVAGTEGDGSGLGLAIVKEIVDRHGGAVSIDLRDGGAGTRICGTFPAA